MDLAKVLQELHQELDNLNSAIHSLERLQLSSDKRGAAPEWIAALEKPMRPARRRRNESE